MVLDHESFWLNMGVLAGFLEVVQFDDFAQHAHQRQNESKKTAVGDAIRDTRCPGGWRRKVTGTIPQCLVTWL